MYIDNSQVFVDMECERTLPGWKPRRLGLLHSIKIHTTWMLMLGGGLGGKKESGQLRFGGKDRPFRKPMYGCYELMITIVCIYSHRVLGKYNLQRRRPGEGFHRDKGIHRSSEHYRHDRNKQWRPHNYYHKHRSRSRSR